MLKVTTAVGDITRFAADAIVVNGFEGVTRLGGATGALDRASDGAVSGAMRHGDFKGKEGTSITLYTPKGPRAPRVIVVGLGKQKDFSIEGVRRAAGTAVKALGATKARRAATIVHGAGVGGLDPDVCARNVAGASISMAYAFDRKGKPRRRPKTGDADDDPKGPRLEELVLVEREPAVARQIAAGAARGIHVSGAQCFTRDVASWSGDEGSPAAIAGAVAAMARRHRLRCRVLGPAAMKKERMSAVLGVHQGSAKQPRFVVLEHKPPRAERTICLVGKGVCFDTGGISIKSADNMDKMKYDKSGAAAVFGALQAAARLKTRVHVIGLAPLVENMPSGTALKPGDVLPTRSGLTVEVLNTDAEGRLVLADALDYAKDLGADHTVDLATLTGAVQVALGTQAIGLLSNDERLADKLVAAGEETHERVWQLPFWKEYEKQIESKVADVKNTGGRGGGTITAGKFLERFAPDSWAHLDIASTAWNDDRPFFNGHYYPEGATGVGVRLLTAFLAQEEGA